MSRIKEDLICEIIRLSQTNLLDKKCTNMSFETQEQAAMDWIRKNAANYRVDFQSRLEAFSASRLGEILKDLTETGKDLSDILEGIEPVHRG
jgi:plasmid replication initiation protein